MALPCVLFSSSVEDYNPRELVKNILDVTELPAPKVISDNIQSYEWYFENKYYSTTINLCTTNSRTIGDQDFAESVEAFVHYFDPNQLASFELAKAWLPYLKHIEPEIQILVCECSKYTDAVCRKETLAWCVKNGFELVELTPEKDEDDEDDDFPETTGMARIIQALNAHAWPNLDMKDSPPVQSPYLRQMMKEQQMINQREAQASQNSHSDSCTNANDNKPVSPSEAVSEKESTDSIPSVGSNANNETNESSNTESGHSDISNVRGDKTGAGLQQPSDAFSTASRSADCTKGSAGGPGVDEQLPLDDINWKSLFADSGQTEVPLADDELGVEEFEQLFMKLKVMKGKAETMPVEERKKYAEKVAISFWKAIGGDDEEILGLDDSDAD